LDDNFGIKLPVIIKKAASPSKRKRHVTEEDNSDDDEFSLVNIPGNEQLPWKRFWVMLLEHDFCRMQQTTHETHNQYLT